MSSNFDLYFLSNVGELDILWIRQSKYYHLSYVYEMNEGLAIEIYRDD